MLSTSWIFWALLSAGFAALTALCAKIGVSSINSDLATFIRTLVILGVLGIMLLATGKFHETGGFSQRACLFLLLSGLATGASWLCYFRALKLGDAARVAPLDKLSVVFVAVLGVTVFGEHLSLKGWLGILCIGLGAILVSLG